MKNSKTAKSYWPIYLRILSVSPASRAKKWTLLPLLFIIGKPKELDTFLAPIIPKLKGYLEDGFEVWDCADGLENRIKTRKYLLISEIIGASPATAVLCKFVTAKGKRPCHMCLARNITLRYDDRMHGQVLVNTHRDLYIQSDYTDYTVNQKVRSPEHTQEIMQRFDNIKANASLSEFAKREQKNAITRKTGYKDKALLMSLFPFSFGLAGSWPLEFAHVILFNVAKLLFNATFGKDGYGPSFMSSKNIQEIHHILDFFPVFTESGGSINTVNCLSSDISGCTMRADEAKLFVATFAYPLLKDRINSSALNTWVHFIRATRLAFQYQLSSAQILELFNHCNEFVKQFEAVFASPTFGPGPSDVSNLSILHRCTVQLHYMLHIASVVADNGPGPGNTSLAFERQGNVINRRQHAQEAARRMNQSGFNLPEKLPAPWAQETMTLGPYTNITIPIGNRWNMELLKEHYERFFPEVSNLVNTARRTQRLITRSNQTVHSSDRKSRQRNGVLRVSCHVSYLVTLSVGNNHDFRVLKDMQKFSKILRQDTDNQGFGTYTLRSYGTVHHIILHTYQGTEYPICCMECSSRLYHTTNHFEPYFLLNKPKRYLMIAASEIEQVVMHVPGKDPNCIYLAARAGDANDEIES